MTGYGKDGRDGGTDAAPAAAAALEIAELTELEARLRQRAGREMYERGHEDGYRQGYERGARLLEESWPDVVRPVLQDRPEHAALEARRWGPGGREHFADPRPGDRTPAGMVANATASWEPFGLPEPGMVHLSGPVVHWHRPCTAPCYAYRPGWYTFARAAGILATLPGDYGDTIAELKERAAREGRRTAA